MCNDLLQNGIAREMRGFLIRKVLPTPICRVSQSFALIKASEISILINHHPLIQARIQCTHVMLTGGVFLCPVTSTFDSFGDVTCEP